MMCGDVSSLALIAPETVLVDCKGVAYQAIEHGGSLGFVQAGHHVVFSCDQLAGVLPMRVVDDGHAVKPPSDAATREQSAEGQTGDLGEATEGEPTDKPCPTCGGDKRFTTGTLSGDLRELAKLIRDQTEQDWIGVTESNSVNETLESAQAWRHNCRVYAEGVEQAAGYIEDDGLAEAGRSVIADRLAEQLANGVPPEEIEWPEAWANLAREIKKYGGGSRD